MTTEGETTIVLADDHPIFRKGLRDVIEANLRFCVCGEAGDGEAALALIREHRPRVAVVDIEMPGCNGIEVTRAVDREKLPVSIIILTMYDDDDLFNEVMEAGAMGYILKDSAILEIVRGITRVAEGEFYVSAAMSSSTLRRKSEFQPIQRERLGLHLLTGRERQILQLIASEKSSREISEELNISPRTVDNHRVNICAKLNLSGVYTLIRFATKYKPLI